MQNEKKPDEEEKTTPINTHQEEETTLQTLSKGKKMEILGIVSALQLWLNFPIHEAIAIERENMPTKEKMSNYEIECLGTPPNKAAKLHTLQHVFPRVV